MSKKKKKGSKVSVVLVVVAVLVILCCSILAAALVVLKFYTGKFQRIDDEDVTRNYNYVQHALDDGVLDEGDLATLSSDEEAELKAKFGSIAEMQGGNVEELAGDTYSILLIGSDRRSSNWAGNSDAMILLTINGYTKKIYMISLMRDLYADIPDYGVRKLNAAHAIGGGPLLVETIEKNYGVLINNYASVDFNSMSAIVDMVGGVDIDVSADEARVANNYVTEICSLQGLDPAPYALQGGGICHLNGIQAVAFGRIRYVGNADYERTSRQREILSAIVAKAKSMSISQLNDLVLQMLPYITTNIDDATLLNLIAKVPDLMGYEVVQDRVPYDGLYYTSNELLIPDMEQTIQRLQSTIYARE